MVRPPRRTDRCVLPPAGGAAPRVRFPGAASQRRPPPPVQVGSATTEEDAEQSGRRQLGAQGRTGGSGETEPKRVRTDGAQDIAASTNQEKPSGSCGADGDVPGAGQQGAAEDSRPAELQSVRSLKVTIQQRSDSRAFSRPAAGPHCHVCDLTCRTLQVFQEHMSSAAHLDKLQEVTRCIRRHTRVLQDRGRRPETQRWCNACQTHFSGNVIAHRRTKQHKVCKQLCRPFCPVCRCHFRTPRKFVEHMKSPEHKEKVQQEEAQEEELIIVDAIGCFQAEEEEVASEEEEEVEVAEEEEEEEEEVEVEVASEEEEEVEVAEEEEEEVEEEQQEEETDVRSDVDASEGGSFVVPVCGFVCRLCSKFFYTEAAARHTHCRTHTHRLNLQRHRAAMKRSEEEEDEG